MQGARVIIDGRHAVRQHWVFAVFVVLGLLAVAAVWYWQVRSAVQNGAVAELQQGIEFVGDTWEKNRAAIEAAQK